MKRQLVGLNLRTGFFTYCVHENILTSYTSSMFENEFNAKQIPKLILFQFRQLDVVEDSKVELLHFYCCLKLIVKY